MDSIFASGRMEYLKSEKPDGCVFCTKSIREGELVLLEGENCYIIMNKYPYTSGHLLVVPYRHVCNLEDLSSEEMTEMAVMANSCVKILKKVFNAEGFNIGMNVGKAAGAGVDTHLHLHIVPRWPGDTNFITVLGEVRIIPESVSETRDVLLPYFRKDKEI
jgi:ATP adenylyltransferase